MRRSEREITDRGEIEEIIRRSAVCRVAMTDEEGPYVVPVNFGYAESAIWFHSAKEGRKISALRADPRVCVQMDIDVRMAPASHPCDWTMKYRSVVAFGKAKIVEDPAEKRRGLDAIMRHYGGPVGNYDESMFERTVLVRIDIKSITGKKAD